MEKFKAGKIHFLSEQDGPSEQLLKLQLSAYLSCVPEVELAYMVKISHDKSPDKSVALCLAGGEQKEGEIVESVRAIFRELFRNTESLDILFLKEDQRREVHAVAKAFYRADESEGCRPN